MNSSFDEIYEEFCVRVKNAQWTWLCWNPNSAHNMVHCLQTTSTSSCHAIAPLVLHRYVTGSKAMVDINHVDNRSLVEINSAQRILDELFAHGACDYLFSINMWFADNAITVAQQLERHGPCLVSQFIADTDFGVDKVSFIGKKKIDSSKLQIEENSDSSKLREMKNTVLIDSSKLREMHAMVMIGYRFDANKNEFVFLLQNWWSSAPLIEVSASYLSRARAVCTFVHNVRQHVCMRPMTDASFVTTTLDTADNYPDSQSMFVNTRSLEQVVFL